MHAPADIQRGRPFPKRKVHVLQIAVRRESHVVEIDFIDTSGERVLSDGTGVVPRFAGGRIDPGELPVIEPQRGD